MRDIPIEVIASWPPGNYTNPETRGNTLVIVNVVLMSLVTFVVFLRLYVRVYLLRWFGIDDLFIIIALIATAGFTACVILANVHFGWNRHVWDIPLTKLPAALQVGWATKMLYAVAACFTRQSLLLFYYRLVRDGSMKSFRRVIHIASIYSVVTMLLLVILTLLQCDPIRAFWVWPRMSNSRCWDDGLLTVGCGIANTFADLLVTIIPIPLIARLELPRRRRIGAFIFVGTGFLICAAGVARAFYTWRSLISSYDQTWESYGMFMSAAIEIDLGVICACVPALRILLVKFTSSTISIISSHLSHATPFGSKVTKNSEGISSFSDATYSSPTKGGILEMVAKGPGIMTGPNSTSATATDRMKEAGFIVTRGSSVLSNSRSGTPCPQYMWDEPWSGGNAPRTMLEHEIKEEDPDRINFDNSLVTTASTKTASRVLITPQRANTIRVSTSTTIMRSPSRTAGGLNNIAMEQKGVGILPDAVSSRKSIQRPESPDDDDDMDLPIQGTPVSESRPRESRLSEPYIDNRLSWLKFDLDSSKESARPQTSGTAPGGRRLSWLDDRSHENLYDERRQSLREKEDVNVDVRERGIRTLDKEKRGEELGWDLGSNRSEMRDSW